MAIKPDPFHEMSLLVAGNRGVRVVEMKETSGGERLELEEGDLLVAVQAKWKNEVKSKITKRATFNNLTQNTRKMLKESSNSLVIIVKV